MGRALSEDLRLRVLAARTEEGLTIAEAAERYSVGTASVKRWTRVWRETGGVAPKRNGGDGPEPTIRGHLETVLLDLSLANSDATLPELARLFEEATGVHATRHTVGRGLARLGITRKKSPSSRPKPKQLGS